MESVISDMSATVWKILVSPGDTVQEEQEVVILESMKMEIPVASHIAGKVARIHVEEGGVVDEGASLLDIESS